jgi:hypothetical protein
MDPRPSSVATRGLEHPDEVSEFARFCLLNHYARNKRFRAELSRLASRHEHVLDLVARQPVSARLSVLADYRAAWGILSFLARDPASGKSAHPLKGAIASYRANLLDLAKKWGLDAGWCAPSLHVALLAPRTFPGNFEDAFQDAGLTPLFMWDLERQGRPPYDTLITLPRLLLRPDAPGRRVDSRLISHADGNVHYDPRMDRWEDSLARVRKVLDRKRLSPACKQNLLRRRREIESAFAAEGYAPRRNPRRLRRQHALARWTYWTYLAIRHPRQTTDQILESLRRRDIGKQYIDRAIKKVLDLLDLPDRPVRHS